MENRTTPRTQIRNLLIIIFLGVACAGLVSAFMLYRYSPTGAYLAKNVLLEPGMVEGLSYEAKGVRYTFDRLEFLFFDEEKGEWRRMQLDVPQYHAIYDKISEDKSILEVNEEVRSQFNRGNPSMLTLVVRAEAAGSKNVATKVFQQLQFADKGDYFRVELVGAKIPDQWAYYYHHDIDEIVIQHLTQLP